MPLRGPIYTQPGSTASLTVHDDGDWSVAAAVGPALREYPFQSRGDRITYIVRQPFQQSAASFSPLSANTSHPTYPQALLIEEGPHRDLGGGKIEWERKYATIPQSRQEPESYNYEFQYYLNDNLGSLVLTVDSTVTYDYFLRSNKGSFPLSLAPKVVKAGTSPQKIGSGDLHQVGTVIVSSDALILAENDTYGDWMGEIMFRKRRQITGPTVAFWGSALNQS